jgi:anti-sigma regulatory factor (Ser/Thr protein kinase)
VIDDIELLVSELVTNAVLHARSDARVTIELLDDRVRVTVADASPIVPRLRDYGPAAVTGRGMLLVDRLSDQWGVDVDDGAGKRVWFELPVAEHTRSMS